MEQPARTEAVVPPAPEPPTPMAVRSPPPTAPPTSGNTNNALAWEQIRLQQELQAALDSAAASQRAAAAAEQMAAQQQASFALTLRRERERMRTEHQAEVAKMWSQISEASELGESK